MEQSLSWNSRSTESVVNITRIKKICGLFCHRSYPEAAISTSSINTFAEILQYSKLLVQKKFSYNQIKRQQSFRGR